MIDANVLFRSEDRGRTFSMTLLFVLNKVDQSVKRNVIQQQIHFNFLQNQVQTFIDSIRWRVFEELFLFT